MNRNGRSENGAFTIDAILGITFFMIAILTIIFMSLIVKAQSNVQYALSQTAKEISGYYYILDKAGIAAAMTSGNSQGVKDIDDTVGYIFDFADQSVDMKNTVSSIDITNGLDVDDFQNMSSSVDNAKELYQTASSIGTKLKTIGDDPKSQIQAVLSVFAKTMVNKGLSYYVAPMVCKAVMPKYMGGDRESTNKMLENVGIEGGIDKIDFSQSQLLTDNRSIKLVAVYELNAEKLTFGIVRKKLVFKQVASTAAWIVPDGSNIYALSQLNPPAIPGMEESTEASTEDTSEGS